MTNDGIYRNLREKFRRRGDTSTTGISTSPMFQSYNLFHLTKNLSPFNFSSISLSVSICHKHGHHLYFWEECFRKRIIRFAFRSTKYLSYRLFTIPFISRSHAQNRPVSCRTLLEPFLACNLTFPTPRKRSVLRRIISSRPRR